MPRDHFEAASAMIDLILDRIAELDRAIAESTDVAEIQRLTAQRLDAFDMLTALTRHP